MSQGTTVTDPSIIIVVVTLVVFVLCILVLTKACECVYGRNREETTSAATNRSSIYIIEENGDVLVINPGDGDVEKCDVKHSYENLAPPPYFVVLDTLAEASYELPPSYPIDT